jgi:protein LTV1
VCLSSLAIRTNKRRYRQAEGVAEGEGDEYSRDCVESEEECWDSEEEDEVNSLFSQEGSDQGCRFTEYSVSSSVLPRNEGLTLLDDRFEEVS